MTMSMIDGGTFASRLNDVRLYDGVRTRRIMAFLVDFALVTLISVPVFLLVLVLGLITLGLGWMLIGGIWPVVALIYIWNTLGSSRQATVGMSLMGIRLERLDGAPVDGMLAVVHSVLFWAFNAVLTPLILLVALFSDRKRLLQDLLLGTVVVRTDR
jgi:uncharacterized RDD family membrane protein YckC